MYSRKRKSLALLAMRFSDGGTQPPAEPPTDGKPAEPPADGKPATEPPADGKPPADAKVVPKNLFDKTASELAKVKKQLQDRMTEDELKAAAAEEARLEIETLRKAATTAKLEANLAKTGVANSAEIAEMFAAGNIEDAITALAAAKDAQLKTLQDELTTLKQRGATEPPLGEPNSAFAGKSIAELMTMANESPAKQKQILAYIATMNKKE